MAEKQPVARIAVMSDLHCHPSAGAEPGSEVKEWHSVLHTDALRSDDNPHPIEALRSLIKRRTLSANVIVCPGDLTNKVNRQGIISGWGFVKEVGGALACSTIVAALGNHDVDSRKIHKHGIFHLSRGVRNNFPVPAGTCEDQYYSRGYCFIETPQVRLLMINSVLEHHDEKKAKRGEWTIQHLDGLRSDLAMRTPHALEIAVLHHHPVPHADLGLDNDDLMINGAGLVEALADAGFLMLIHGHKHHPKLRYFSRGASKLLVFASGSFSAVDPKGMLPSVTRHLFHIVDVLDTTQGLGVIRSWEWNGNKGWNNATMQSADFPHHCGFGLTTPIAQLAESVMQVVATRPRVFWDEVEAALPMLAFLTYEDFSSLKECLTVKHGLHVRPEGSDWPTLIGRNAN